jgi:hypothetical protein
MTPEFQSQGLTGGQFYLATIGNFKTAIDIQEGAIEEILPNNQKIIQTSRVPLRLSAGNSMVICYSRRG